jgi:uncharacterized pyridoxamine 5'-phosphate oxidase family protein
MLKRIYSYYKDQQIVYLATSEKFQPRVRPVTLIHMNGRFFVITGARGGASAGKILQIKENPRIEYYLTLEGEDSNTGFIRGEGEARIVEDPILRAEVYDMVNWAKEYFSTVDHPDYYLLEIKHTSFNYRNPGEYEIQEHIV